MWLGALTVKEFSWLNTIYRHLYPVYGIAVL